MERYMTRQEIESQFPSEWVLIGDPKKMPHHEIEGGIVLYHSKDRDEVYDKAVELRPNYSAVVYTGTIPEDAAIVL